jgi:hypothetical protein
MWGGAKRQIAHTTALSRCWRGGFDEQKAHKAILHLAQECRLFAVEATKLVKVSTV